MSLFELQIATSPFLVAQRNYLRSLALCPPLLPPVAGVGIVVDRIDVGASVLRQGAETEFAVFLEDGGQLRPTDYPATGRPVVLEQRLTLQLTTDADVRAHPNAAPSSVPVEVVLGFVLSAYTTGDECFLRADLDAVEVVATTLPAPLPDTLPPEVVAEISAFLTAGARLFAPSGTVPMGLAGLRPGLRFLNAGLALDAAGQTLAVRVQVGGSSWYSYGPWTTFYSGHLTDRMAGNDWSLFVEAGYLTETAKTVLGESLPRDDDLDAYPDCTYRAQEDGQAVLDVSALLIYHAVEVEELGLDVTAEAEPHVLLRPSVPAPGRLAVDVDFSRLLEVRGFLSGFALSVIHLLGIPAEQILLRLAGSAAVEALAGAGVDVEQTSPTTIRVEQAIAVPAVPGSLRSQVTALLALPDGVAVAGSLTTTELTSAVPEVAVAEFRVAAPRVTCGPASIASVAAFRDDPSGFRVLHAAASIRNAGTAPLRMCAPVRVVRPDGPVAAADVRVDAGQPPIELSVDIAAPGAAYAAAPYPVDLLVRTNGGTRLVRFAPPPVVDAARYESLAAELLVAIGDCQQLVDPWLRTHRGYNPQWSPRPPEDGSRFAQLWEVVVSGLPVGEGARLVDRRGRVLVSAVSAGSPVHLTAVVGPAAGGREIRVERVDAAPRPDAAAPGPGTTAAGGGLEIRQTNLVAEGVVGLPAPARGIGSVPVSGVPTVVALFDEGAVAYAATSASPAAAAVRWPGRFTGMLRSGDHLLLYGEDGLASVDRSGRLTPTALDVPVEDATVGPEGVVAVTRDRVVTLSPTFEVSSEVAVPGAVAAAHARGRLLVGDRHGVTEVGRAGAAARRALGDGAGVVALTRAPFVDAGAVLARLDDHSARVLLPGPDGLRETARYDAVPWFADAVRVGDRLVRLSADHDRLELYRMGASVLR